MPAEPTLPCQRCFRRLIHDPTHKCDGHNLGVSCWYCRFRKRGPKRCRPVPPAAVEVVRRAMRAAEAAAGCDGSSPQMTWFHRTYSQANGVLLQATAAEKVTANDDGFGNVNGNGNAAVHGDALKEEETPERERNGPTVDPVTASNNMPAPHAPGQNRQAGHDATTNRNSETSQIIDVTFGLSPDLPGQGPVYRSSVYW